MLVTNLVTNAEFSRFIDAGGYQNPHLWARNILSITDDLEVRPPWTAPEGWSNERKQNTHDRPVVGVSLFEAMAYAKWLSKELGYEVRVPSEAEWTKAALEGAELSDIDEWTTTVRRPSYEISQEDEQWLQQREKTINVDAKFVTCSSNERWRALPTDRTFIGFRLVRSEVTE